MKELKWWQKAVIYQVYPRSFLDTDGDGNGNFRGIMQKLDYLSGLGVDAIWLNPVNASPMADNGYDISDYYRANSLFGTDEELFELIAEANRHGIRVIMDMVLNHCSDQHAYFQKALADPEGEYAKYFYFRRGKDGKAPNNWRSVFGGSVWTKVPGTEYYYLHIFTPQQPDLNWENEELRRKIYEMMNFWIGKGVSGFRLDAISYIKKAAGLPSYPADDADGMVSAFAGSLNQPGMLDLVRELRENTYGRADCFAVGEVSGATPEEALEMISLKNGVFSSIFDFSYIDMDICPPNYFWCERVEWTPDDFKSRLYRSQRGVALDGWYTNTIETHDTPRSASRFLPEEGRNYYGKSMLAVLYMLLRGTPVVFQGQEIGMENFPLPCIEEYDDVSSHNNYKVALQKGYSPEEALRFIQLLSRDNTRLPMCWTDGKNGGFSEGASWLPAGGNAERINVRAQEAEEHSLLHFYRKLIALRKRSFLSEVLLGGSLEPVWDEASGVIAYVRQGEYRKVLVICNFQNTPAKVLLEGDWKTALDNYTPAAVYAKGEGPARTGTLTLKAWQALVLYEDQSRAEGKGEGGGV